MDLNQQEIISFLNSKKGLKYRLIDVIPIDAHVTHFGQKKEDKGVASLTL